jgi:hypothetical protein
VTSRAVSCYFSIYCILFGSHESFRLAELSLSTLARSLAYRTNDKILNRQRHAAPVDNWRLADAVPCSIAHPVCACASRRKKKKKARSEEQRAAAEK